MLTPITPQSAERITALVIGRPGIGKTSLLRTLPATERACTLSAESGLLCVRDLIQAGQVTGFEIHSLADFEEALAYLRSPDYQAAYQWVFIDSLTEIASRCLEKYQALHPDRKDSFKLYGDYTDHLTKLIKAFRDLAPYNVVFTCLETVELDEAKRRFIAPDITGKQLKERLPSYFDEVFYYTTQADAQGQPERAFYTQPIFFGLPGKDRSGRLAPVETPNLAAIKAKILGA